jgi:hypothetical protein
MLKRRITKMTDMLNAKVLAIIATHELLRYYHSKGWITDKEFLRFETDVEIGDICDFLDERAKKLLKDICDKEKEDL